MKKEIMWVLIGTVLSLATTCSKERESVFVFLRFKQSCRKKSANKWCLDFLTCWVWEHFIHIQYSKNSCKISDENLLCKFFFKIRLQYTCLKQNGGFSCKDVEQILGPPRNIVAPRWFLIQKDQSFWCF